MRLRARPPPHQPTHPPTNPTTHTHTLATRRNASVTSLSAARRRRQLGQRCAARAEIFAGPPPAHARRPVRAAAAGTRARARRRPAARARRPVSLGSNAPSERRGPLREGAPRPRRPGSFPSRPPARTPGRGRRSRSDSAGAAILEKLAPHFETCSAVSKRFFYWHPTTFVGVFWRGHAPGAAAARVLWLASIGSRRGAGSAARRARAARSVGGPARAAPRTPRVRKGGSGNASARASERACV